MKRISTWTTTLALAGTVLTCLPIVAPVVLAVIALFARGRFLLDYLMPAELFPLALVGALLLVWAALRAHARRLLIGGSLAVAVAALVASQGLAVVSGLASGEMAPTGWWWAIVLGLLAVYTLSLGAIVLGGILLLRDIAQHAPRLLASSP